MDQHQTLESAIPAHLVHQAAESHRPEGYAPPYPSFVGRFRPEIASVTMAYFGTQTADPDDARLRDAHHDLAQSFAAPNGPERVERAGYVDERGYTNVISIAYWSSTTMAEVWMANHGASWMDPARTTDGIGYFVEQVTPTTERFETLFSSNDRTEGVASIAEQFSGPIVEHAYWGGMRDRLPRSQFDRMEKSGDVTIDRDGLRRTVGPQHNVCLIRSGQDYTDTGDVEREFYLREVEPSLRAGMEFLRDDGRSIGCYSNRYMTVLDDDLRPVEKTFGMSWWNDLASLEAWAKSHDTHLKIFGAAMKHLSTFGPETRLRLYHEVTVAALDQQAFTYLGCHDDTGLLRATG